MWKRTAGGLVVVGATGVVGSLCALASTSCGSSGCPSGRLDSTGACMQSASTEAPPDAAATTAADSPATGDAPAFGGVTSVAPAGPRSLQITWNAGYLDGTDAARLRYRVYMAAAPAELSYAKPRVTTAPGAGSIIVSDLEPKKGYVIGVRAASESGREDANTVRMTADTVVDGQPPTFTGAGRAIELGGGLIRVAWAPAKDDLTPGPGIAYLVLVADASGLADFAKPTVVTQPGALVATVVGEPSGPNRIIVRARDAWGNVDANTTQVTSQTGASFAYDVQPIFTFNCAMPGCHVPGNPLQKMILTPGFAYREIVNVPSTWDRNVMRVVPGEPANSFLVHKIMGTQPRTMGMKMPAPATGGVLLDADKDLIKQWIAQGAQDN